MVPLVLVNLPLYFCQPCSPPLAPHALPAQASLLSVAYITQASASCFWWSIHVAVSPRSCAWCKTGSSTAARMAMMAMTTNNSMSVKATTRVLGETMVVTLDSLLSVIFMKWTYFLCLISFPDAWHFETAPKAFRLGH